MLTIFSCPKPFQGVIGTIQRNALRSWVNLVPKQEIMLIGNEHGVKEIVKEYGLIHIPEVERNKFGTPILSSIFDNAQKYSSNEFLCYCNADIILLDDFLPAVNRIIDFFKKDNFFTTGRRILMDIEGDLTLDSNENKNDFYQMIKKNGTLDRPDAMDYFIFKKGAIKGIPPFALGRCGWDNWLLFNAKKNNLAVVDATKSIRAIHQNHNYMHSKFINKGSVTFITGPEVISNRKLCEGSSKFFNLFECSYIVDSSSIKRIGFLRLIKRYEFRLRSYLSNLIKYNKGIKKGD